MMDYSKSFVTINGVLLVNPFLLATGFPFKVILKMKCNDPLFYLFFLQTAIKLIKIDCE